MKKFRIPLITIGFGAIVSIGFASTISGSLAWWAYSTRSSIGFHGTSVASSEQLQIGIKTSINMSSFGMITYEDAPGYYFCSAGTGLQANVISHYLKTQGQYAYDELIPITSGSYETGDTLALKSSLVAGVPYNNMTAEKSKYVHIPLAFRILKYDSSHELEPAKGENIWLSEAVVEAFSVYDGEVYKSIRMYTEGYEAVDDGGTKVLNPVKRLINPSSTEATMGKTAVAGILDLSGSGFYDTYTKNEKEYEIIYGQTNKTEEELIALETVHQDEEESSDIDDFNGTGDDSEASTFVASHFMDTWRPVSLEDISPKYQNYDTLTTVQAIDTNNGILTGGKPLCATDLTRGIADLNLTVWLEGWDHHVIDKENHHSFNLGLQFMISRL